VAVSLEAITDPAARSVPLPSYSWQHQRFPVPQVSGRLDDPGPESVAPDPPAHTLCSESELLPDEPSARRALVFAFVLDTLADTLAYDVSLLDPSTGFFQLGMDSAMAVRIRQLIQGRFGIRLAVPVLFEHPTVNALTDHLAVLLASGNREAQPSSPPSNTPEPERALDELSEDELLAVLEEEIRRSQKITTEVES
jgi:acyl carrier protein